MPTTNPVPSNDPTDLLFNAQKLDQVVNGSSQYYTDRLGVNRRTMEGISAAADVVLGGIGYAPPVAYAAGISMTLTTQTVEYSGEVYAPKVGNLPFTTSGTFETAKFRLIQGVAATDLAASGGSAMVGYIPAGTGAVATTVQAKLRESVSVKDFGAVGDGVTDDTATINAAIATGRSINLGGYENTYLISGPLTLGAGQCLFGYGATVKTTSNISMVVMAENCRVTGLKFLGNSTGASQRGIFIDGSGTYAAVCRTQVDGCQFKNLGGSAYYVTRVVDAHQGNVFMGNTITMCTIGVEIDERGEYTSVTGNNIDQCGTGIKIVGGNTNVVGGVVSNCTTGILLASGANDAHGSVSGVLVNHSTQYSVKVDSITVSEFRFIGCTIYYGDLWLRYCSGVLFDACTFGSINNFYFEQAIDNYFVAPRFIGNMPAFNNRYLGTQSCTHYVNSITMGLSSGQSAPDINGGYLEVQLASNISLATGTQIVPFDTPIYNAITNDLNFTYISFFDVSAGSYTFRNLEALKSPNKNFFVDVDIAISIGVSAGAVDYSKIRVYLYEVSTARVVANFTPSVQEYGSNPGVSWKVYTLQGRVALPGSPGYRVVVDNGTGGNVMCWREQGTNLPFTAKFSNF